MLYRIIRMDCELCYIWCPLLIPEEMLPAVSHLFSFVVVLFVYNVFNYYNVLMILLAFVGVSVLYLLTGLTSLSLLAILKLW